MLTFVLRRLLLAVPVLLGVVFVVMLTVDLLPGDAVALMLGEHATPDAVARLRDHLGLDKPFLVRYLEYVGRVARGDLGRSIQQNRPVAAELADAWPATLELTLAALLIATVAGITAGVASAVWPNSFFDVLARLGSLFGLSMPIFWTGLVLIVVFSLWLNWLPVGGAGSLGHLVLPAVTLALPSVAMVARMTRSAVLDVLREDYVRTARAKGVGELWVVGHHTLRNAFIPILTLIGLQSGQLMGGAVLTETVFAWPGLGRLMVKAIFARDYVLLQGAVLLFALAFVIINWPSSPSISSATACATRSIPGCAAAREPANLQPHLDRSATMNGAVRRLFLGGVLVLTLTVGVAAQPQVEVAKLLRVEWDTQAEAWTRPRLAGHVYNDSSYRIGSVRLRVEVLDAAQQKVREELAWIYVDVPARGRAYFSVRRPGGEAFRVTVESFVLIARETINETP